MKKKRTFYFLITIFLITCFLILLVILIRPSLTGNVILKDGLEIKDKSYEINSEDLYMDRTERALIIYNENDNEARDLAEYYAAAREMDESRICGVRLPTGSYASAKDLKGARKTIIEDCVCGILKETLPENKLPNPCDLSNINEIRDVSPISHLVFMKGIPYWLINSWIFTGGYSDPASFGNYMSIYLYEDDDIFTKDYLGCQVFDQAFLTASDFQQSYYNSKTANDPFESWGYLGGLSDSFFRNSFGCENLFSCYERPDIPRIDKVAVYGYVQAVDAERTKELIDRTIEAEKKGINGNFYTGLKLSEETYSSSEVNNEYPVGAMYMPQSSAEGKQHYFLEYYHYLIDLTESHDQSCSVILNGEKLDVENCRIGRTTGNIPGESGYIPKAIDTGIYLGFDFVGQGQAGFDGVSTMLNWRKTTESCIPLCKNLPTLKEQEDCMEKSTDYYKDFNTDCVGANPSLIGNQLRSYTVSYYSAVPPMWSPSGGKGVAPQWIQGDAFKNDLFTDDYYVRFGSISQEENLVCYDESGLEYACPETVSANLFYLNKTSNKYLDDDLDFNFVLRYRGSEKNKGKTVTINLLFELNNGSNKEKLSDSLKILIDPNNLWKEASGKLNIKIEDTTLTGKIKIDSYKVSFSANYFQNWLEYDGIEFYDSLTKESWISKDIGSFNAQEQMSTYSGDYAFNAIDRLGGIAWWGSGSHHCTNGFAFNYRSPIIPTLLSGRSLGEALRISESPESGLIFGDPLYSPTGVKIYTDPEYINGESPELYINPHLQPSVGSIEEETFLIKDINVEGNLNLKIMAFRGRDLVNTNWQLDVCYDNRDVCLLEDGKWENVQKGSKGEVGKTLDMKLKDFVLQGEVKEKNFVSLRLRVWNKGEEDQRLTSYAYFYYKNESLIAENLGCVDEDKDGYYAVSSECSLGSDCDDGDKNVWRKVTLYTDKDGDGYTTSANLKCLGGDEVIPEGYTQQSFGGDCDDNDPTKYEGGPIAIDKDGDGYPGFSKVSYYCYEDGLPEGYAEYGLSRDCDDNDANVWASLIYTDKDGDGYSYGSSVKSGCFGDNNLPQGYVINRKGIGDCDDNNPNEWKKVSCAYDRNGDGFTYDFEQFCTDDEPIPFCLTYSLGDDCEELNWFGVRKYVCTYFNPYTSYNEGGVFILDKGDVLNFDVFLNYPERSYYPVHITNFSSGAHYGLIGSVFLENSFVSLSFKYDFPNLNLNLSNVKINTRDNNGAREIEFEGIEPLDEMINLTFSKINLRSDSVCYKWVDEYSSEESCIDLKCDGINRLGTYCLYNNTAINVAGNRYNYLIEKKIGGSDYALVCDSIEYTDWSKCENGISTREVSLASPNGCQINALEPLQKFCEDEFIDVGAKLESSDYDKITIGDVINVKRIVQNLGNVDMGNIGVIYSIFLNEIKIKESDESIYIKKKSEDEKSELLNFEDAGDYKINLEVNVEGDSDKSNNEAFKFLTVYKKDQSDLSGTIEGQNEIYYAGNNYNFLLTLFNNGEIKSSNAVIKVSLSRSCSSGSCSEEIYSRNFDVEKKSFYNDGFSTLFAEPGLYNLRLVITADNDENLDNNEYSLKVLVKEKEKPNINFDSWVYSDIVNNKNSKLGFKLKNLGESQDLKINVDIEYFGEIQKDIEQGRVISLEESSYKKESFVLDAGEIVKNQVKDLSFDIAPTKKGIIKVKLVFESNGGIKTVSNNFLVFGKTNDVAVRSLILNNLNKGANTIKTVISNEGTNDIKNARVYLIVNGKEVDDEVVDISYSKSSNIKNEKEVVLNFDFEENYFAEIIVGVQYIDSDNSDNVMVFAKNVSPLQTFSIKFLGDNISKHFEVLNSKNYYSGENYFSNDNEYQNIEYYGSFPPKFGLFENQEDNGLADNSLVYSGVKNYKSDVEIRTASIEKINQNSKNYYFVYANSPSFSYNSVEFRTVLTKKNLINREISWSDLLRYSVVYCESFDFSKMKCEGDWIISKNYKITKDISNNLIFEQYLDKKVDAFAVVEDWFDGDTTELVEDKVDNLIIEKKVFGSVKFKEPVITSRIKEDIEILKENVFIENNKVYINTSGIPEFENVSAHIVLRGINLENPEIYRNGQECGIYCSNIEYKDGVLEFDIIGFSVYEVVEATPIVLPISSSSGSSGSGGGRIASCISDWVCGWSPCSDGKKTLICEDNKNCTIPTNVPKNEIELCMEDTCEDNDGDGYGLGLGCLGLDLNDYDPAINIFEVSSASNIDSIQEDIPLTLEEHTENIKNLKLKIYALGLLLTLMIVAVGVILIVLYRNRRDYFHKA